MSLERRIRELFRTAPWGETMELRNGLVSQYAHERMDAIERTIQAMTLGKDVSGLFPDILKNLATHDLDQKKLVYLYLMNYAKTHPELVILAVNTFVQDSEDSNPLVRALAIRTMGCIRVHKILDYMNIPLRKTLHDENPYVRKTAAICVAKFYDMNPQLATEEGFVEELQNMLSDSNPMVVANVVNALLSIHEVDPSKNYFIVTSETLQRLLNALNESTEWGRITILNAIADYTSQSAEEARHICDRVVPQFQHANPSVVLAAIKTVLLHMPNLPGVELAALKRKMSSPLVTLLSNPAELQYVALRNIRIILQKYPDLLSKELRVFYCKYNDPLYLKLEKLEVMVNLVNATNAPALISELKGYAHEVDVEFVRRSIRAMGQTAVKIPDAAVPIVDVLLDLLDQHAQHIDHEVMITMHDILRKYPEFDDAIPKLSESFEDIEEPEARAAVVWILGEYAEKIPPVKSLLAPFAHSFFEETTQVQLQLLTAAVKLYLKRPDDGKDIVNEMLRTATSKSDNADVRDRGYIYWRLLSADIEVAKKIVLAPRPSIETTIDKLSPVLLEELLHEISSLASVYHRSSSSFAGRGRYGADAMQKQAFEEMRQLAREDLNADNLLDLGDSGDGATPSNDLSILSDLFSNQTVSSPTAGSSANSARDDILSLFAAVSAPSKAPVEQAPAQLDITMPPAGASKPTPAPKPAPAPTTASGDLLDLF